VGSKNEGKILQIVIENSYMHSYWTAEKCSGNYKETFNQHVDNVKSFTESDEDGELALEQVVYTVHEVYLYMSTTNKIF
jgi:hypothetical protein